MEALISDIRYAARTLVKAPAFAAVTVATLALGIGANTAIFSVVNGVLFRPLPYPAPSGLTMVWEWNVPRHQNRNPANPANYAAWAERSRSFSDLSWISWTSAVFTGDAPERFAGLAVSPNLFHALGVQPRLGRGFTEDEGRISSRVAIVSDAMWRRRFGADSTVIGRGVPVAGGVVTIVGVMSADFRPLFHEDYWQPFPMTASTQTFAGRYGVALGRLRPGVSRDQAQAEMQTIAAQLEREQPDFDTGWSVNVVPLTEQVVGGARRTLLLLLGAVGIVLLIACANVGSLLLARAAARQRDQAIRDALGASRWRLVRQRLVESAVLALCGGAVGILLAVWGVAALRAVAPNDIPRLNEVSLDGSVLAYTLFIALLASLGFGLPGALSRSGKLGGVLHGERTVGARDHARLRSALVVAQLALALVLMSGAGLLVRSLWRLEAVNPGFDTERVLTASIQLPQANYASDTAQNAFFDRMVSRARALPGVTSAGLVSWLPLSGIGAGTTFTAVGQPQPAPGMSPTADIRVVDEGYFATLRIPVVRGRGINPNDAGGRPVVVVNETLARQMWPGESALGHRLTVSWWSPNATPEVVGVVGDVHHTGLDGDVRPTIYYPRWQSASSGLYLVLRTTGAPTLVANSLRAAVHELDATVPVDDIGPLTEVVNRSLSDRRYPMGLLGLFAALALVLAAVGIYGVLAFLVGQRTREIGVRMALGARGRDVLALVLGRGLALVSAGIAIGGVVAALATRALSKLLYGIEPGDPATLAAVSLLLLAVALLAAYVPARRATRVDPLVALRYE